MTNDVEAANAIAGLEGKEMGGRILKVNEARPKADSPRRGPGGGRSGGGRGRMDFRVTITGNQVDSRVNRAGKVKALKCPQILNPIFEEAHEHHLPKAPEGTQASGKTASQGGKT
jgi:hypothetical protein